MRPTVPIALGGAGGPSSTRPAVRHCDDPIETLADVAAQTSRITLGTSVLDALLQSPIILARRLAQALRAVWGPTCCRSCFR
jgi:hypothetical protein